MRRATIVAAVLAGLLLAAACGGGPEKPIGLVPVAKIVVSVSPSTTLLVGESAQASASLLDDKGAPLTDRQAQWTSLQPNVALVTPAGLISALQVGSATIRATSGAIASDVQVVVQIPVAVSIVLARDSATILLPNASVQFIPLVSDARGNAIVRPTIFWQSSAPLIASVDANGLVTGHAVGSTTIRASTDGKTASAVVTVRATVTATSPAIAGLSATLRPGATVTAMGTNFAPAAASNVVVVDGVPVTVTAATTTQLTFTLPTTGFACEPTRTVFVQVTATGSIGGGNGTLQVATQRSLAAGQSVIVTNPVEVRCNEIAQTGGRYMLSVYNASRAQVAEGSTGGVSLTVRGAAATTTAATTAVATTAVATTAAASQVARLPAGPGWSGRVSLIGSGAFDRAEELLREREVASVHARTLERSIEFVRRNAAPMRASAAERRRAPNLMSATANQIATVGTITQLKVPNLDATNFCLTSLPIGVRTVYVGQRAIVVEDTATTFRSQATLQGRMDDYLTRIGQEFDAVMWPILTANFGNPLAMDAQLSGTGKVIMVFTPRVNAMQQNRVSGFVVSCDFAPVATAPSSNLGEYFYAMVPTDSAAGFPVGRITRDSWLRSIRSTIIHEVKHVTAFGERISRQVELETMSFEEGTARIAEEIYARAIYGVLARRNVTYANSLYCDARPAVTSAPECAGRPYLMYRHFDPLYTFLRGPEPLSPLGRAFASDVSFYSSAWALLRWANDQYATSESQFLKDLTSSSSTGVANLEARTGRPWEEMLGEWSLALNLDDAAGFTPLSVRLTMPSWNFRDIWLGMCSDFGPCTDPNNTQQVFPLPNPTQPRPHAFGEFSEDVFGISGGSFSLFELSGTQAGRQLIEVKNFAGGDPPPTVRLAIVRVQ